MSTPVGGWEPFTQVQGRLWPAVLKQGQRIRLWVTEGSERHIPQGGVRPEKRLRNLVLPAW